MLWIPVTIAAAGFQVARNAAQRSLMGGGGPWGATLVRFLFGLPFSGLFAAAALLLLPSGLAFAPAYFGWAGLGALAQIGATAALLVAMHRSSFALGTAFQQSGLLFAALIGWLVFGDHLSVLAWTGILLATAALIALSWPRRIDGPADWTAAALGTVSGASFAVSANAFRQAAIALDPAHPIPAAIVTVAVVQALQSLALGGWMALFARTALIAVLRAWRVSLGAGLFGALASSGWFTALALSPAGPVRAVGVVEMPMAALAGNRLFAEHLTLRQWLLGGVTAAGVLLAALA
ncbi:MAG: DMT family transporter [Caulobacter sp.]|nr:DMT family transporter [Caulobacter sp.]